MIQCCIFPHKRTNCTLRNLITFKLNLFEVVRAFIVVVVLQPVNDTSAVFCIRPRKTSHVIVDTIFQLPRRKICLMPFCRIVIISIMQTGSSIFIKRIFIIRSHDNIKRMRYGSAFSLSSSADVIGNAILHTGS